MDEMREASTSGIKRGDFLRGTAAIGVALGAFGLTRTAQASDSGAPTATPPKPKPATAATKAVNGQYASQLPFHDTTDFTNAKKGFIAALPKPGQIKNDQGVLVWNLEQYDFIKPDPNQAAPDTVNPSLWRNAKLNMFDGLFKLTDGLWQVRGYDLSVMSIIRGKSGYIVVDPLISAEVSKAVQPQRNRAF